MALDVDKAEDAVRWVKVMMPLGITHFKVGLSLFTLAGPAAVEQVHQAGGKVFLDLKFYDIPNTVSKAVSAALRLGVWMTNVHIQGGSAMMKSALTAAQGKELLLIGVTVLTSMAEKDRVDLGLRKTLKDQVLYLAKLAQSAGLHGIVASAQEAKEVRRTCGEKFLIVTPGIRPALKETPPRASAQRPKTADDQQRTATPREAIQAGADYLVVGRPILEAADPSAVARQILEECAKD